MIEEQGRVIAVQGTEAWVKTVSQSACQSCQLRNGCGQQVLTGMGRNKERHVRVGNACKAEVGDQVLLGISEAALLQAAVLVYLFPLLGLVTGALAANLLLGLGDGATALTSIAGMGLAFLIVRLCQRRAMSAGIRPELLKIRPGTIGSSG